MKEWIGELFLEWELNRLRSMGRSSLRQTEIRKRKGKGKGNKKRMKVVE